MPTVCFVNIKYMGALPDFGLQVDNVLIANVLVLIIAIYFLFIWGVKLYEGSLGDFAILAWVGAFGGVFYGYKLLTEQNNSLGYLGFIPLITYIFLNIFRYTPIEYKIENGLKRLFFPL